MDDSFVVYLGGGTYMDATGNIVVGQPPNAQIYQKPNGLHIDTKKIQETLKDLSDLLPRDEEGIKKWQQFGIPKGLIQSLSGMAGVVGIIATTLAIYAWAIGVLIAIVGLLTEDDGVSPQLGQALIDIKNRLQGLEQIQRADQMIEIHAKFDGSIDRIAGLLTRLAIEKPVCVVREQIFAEMQIVVDELAVPLSSLRNQSWTTTYDKDSYRKRFEISRLLVFEHSNGSLAEVPPQALGVTVFDYRLGVPMLLYGATTFTALLQIAMPWFRSSGMKALDLRKTADAIERFVLRMQDESLARTEYTPRMVMYEQDLSTSLVWARDDTHEDGPGLEFPHRYPVGAFDLLGYSDAFLEQRYIDHFMANEDTGQRGLFNYRWVAPWSTFDELDKVAAAANDQSRQDYATLQTVTGMLRLINTAAWLRFLTTPPIQSQTVTGSVTDSRHFIDETATVAKSPSIFPVGVIEHDATLNRYDSLAQARIMTQEPGFVPSFHYRVFLRAIRSNFANGAWFPSNYVGDIWIPRYEPTNGDHRCNRLRTEFHQGSILSEVMLFDGPSPSTPVKLSGSARLTATTFDWYVPVVSRSSRYAGFGEDPPRVNVAGGGTKQEKLGTGGVSIHLMEKQPLIALPKNVMGGPAPLVASTLFDVWGSEFPTLVDLLLEKGERRHAQIEGVIVNWQLEWNAGALGVRLGGRKEDRPFQIHIVVEETVYSGEVAPANIGNILSEPQFCEHIHTPFVAEVVNQLVMVPDEFFTEERKAIADAAKMWDRFVKRFVKSGHINPGDPIQFVQNSARDLLARSPSTATLATMIERQMEFARQEAPELWLDFLGPGGARKTSH